MIAAMRGSIRRRSVGPIEVFHTRGQNHVAAGGGTILGVKLCNSCSDSGRYDIETTCATLVKESRNVYKQIIVAAGVIIHVLLVILFYIINMHGFTRIGPTQALLGYTDIVIYLLFNRSYLINIAMNAFKRNHRCNLQLGGFVMWKRGGNHGKVDILIQYL